MKYKYLSVLLIAVFMLSIVNIVNSADIESVGNTVKELCSRGADKKGSSLKVTVKSNGGARVKFIGGLKGDVELSQEQWEGIQRVFKKEQLEDNINYRECVKELLPLFLK